MVETALSPPRIMTGIRNLGGGLTVTVSGTSNPIRFAETTLIEQHG